MPTTPESTSPSRQELLRVIEARDAEVSLLKLMIQKLQLQLARRNRNDFGSTSERFEHVQATLLELQPLDDLQARRAGQCLRPTPRRSIAVCPSTCRAKSTCIGPRRRPRITMPAASRAAAPHVAGGCD